MRIDTYDWIALPSPAARRFDFSDAEINEHSYNPYAKTTKKPPASADGLFVAPHTGHGTFTGVAGHKTRQTRHETPYSESVSFQDGFPNITRTCKGKLAPLYWLKNRL